MTIQRENHDIAALHAKLRLIAPAVMIRREVLPLFLYAPLGSNDNSFEVAKRNALKSGVEIPYNTYWGEWQKHFIMRGSYQIPEDWDLNQATALYLPLGDASDHFNTHPEALVYIDDTPFTSVDVRHRLLMLPEQQRDYAAHTLWLHGWTGLGGSLWGDDRPRLYMQPCYVVQLDDLTQRFVTLAGTALETVETLHADDPIRANLLNALRAAFAVLDTRHPVPGERFYESVPGAYMALVDQISLAGDPLNVRVHAVGHAHIDIAWLWTTDIGGDKAVRSFYTALHLMEQYPEYVYAQSQPQLYEFVRQSDPALFERIKQRVAEKRWEPLGGMWVESDCNLPGAESLVRQFMLGRAYFREQFGAGADSPVLWLPDAFGFPHTLPQIAAEAGMRYFFTIKPRWSAVNQIPYDTFWWQGLDGTRLLAHFSTTPEPGRPTFPPTYNAEARAETVIGSWRNARQKARQRDILMSYGWGDGGGGPTSDMLEAIRVMRAFPGVPHVIPSRAVDFFEALESNNGESAPTWNDELYLETHQGTYTSQHVTKNRHRAVERYAHNMEFLAAMTHRLYPEDYAYPVEKFNEIWQRICLHQFHDILPGSSIGEVYRQALYALEMAKQALDIIMIDAVDQINPAMGDGRIMLVNATSFERDDLVYVPYYPTDKHYVFLGTDGEPLPQQATNRTSGWLIAPGKLPPYSITPLRVREETAPPADTPPNTLTVTPELLENDFVRVELNAAGDIVRVYDKGAAREVLTAPGNVFQIFEDRPLQYDAWNIDISYEDRVWYAEPAASVEVTAAGPLRAALRVRRQIMNSTIEQDISLDYNSPVIRFTTHVVEWAERNMLLKVAFPVNILARQAAYDVQWGTVYRPTHRSTSWDRARYEVVHHRRVELREHGYAVSLLDANQYGGDVHDNVLRLTLLKSATYPDPNADQTNHVMTYALYSHAASDDAPGIRAGYLLENPVWLPKLPYLDKNGEITETVQFVAPVDSPNLIVETVKGAEDGDGCIVRCYESLGGRGRVWLRFGFPLARAYRANILEENQFDIMPDADDTHLLSYDVRPHEIVTLRVIPR